MRKPWSGQPWMQITIADLQTEQRQCAEEGKDLAPLAEAFAAFAAVDLTDEAQQAAAEDLLDRSIALPVRPDYPHREPSDLDGIKAERPVSVDLPSPLPDTAALRDKAYGGWLGRCCGCLLGKPVEGQSGAQIAHYLRAQGRWPLDRYFSLEAPAGVAAACGFSGQSPVLYEGGITCMVEDDDTNYTVTGLAIVKQYGPNFTPENVAHFWLGNIPLFHVCTAERVAYRNLAANIPPPASAQYRNVYREWIGAQIRADFFGYVNPGNPELAADFAWRDAAISHVKNGIYGAMWVAAMLAGAYCCDDVETVIRCGLGQIPATSRLTAAIEHTLSLYHAGFSYDEAIAELRTRWDESRGHDWCHTISNAEIVAIALLWGAQDFEKTICYAVMPGFDTDCNGATAGSVLGVLLGAAQLPAKWTAPLNDTLLTGVAGYHRVSIARMAEETVALVNVK